MFFHGSELGGAAVSAAAGGGRQRQSGTPPVPELGSFVQVRTTWQLLCRTGSCCAKHGTDPHMHRTLDPDDRVLSHWLGFICQSAHRR